MSTVETTGDHISNKPGTAEMGAIEEARERLETAYDEVEVLEFRETVQLIAERLRII